MTNTKIVKYHSHEWKLLVETGWVTWTVDPAGWATMLLVEK